MLQTIRDRAQGWIAWAIVLLISIPFVLWGIESYLGGGGEPVVANVNGIDILARDLDKRVQQARFELRERMGASYEPSELDDKKLRADTLDDMIRESLLLDATRRLGLRVSDQEVQVRILSEPAFQRDGRFDKESYKRILEMQGLSPAMFEAQLRQQMAGGQLIQAVAASEFATRSELGDYQRLAEQKRELSYAMFTVADFQTDAPIDDAAVSSYYDANAAKFQIPEQVKLDYIVLDAAGLAPKVVLSDADLQQFYDSNKARFGQLERRQMRHLLLTLPKDATQAASDVVLNQIKELREKILAGESFDELAKKHSKDPGSAAKGGSLGIVEKGVMVPAFEQAAFALAKGQVSEPVRTEFGYHLIEVTDILPAEVKLFDTVREEIRAELSKQRADSQYYDVGERLATLVYESPDSLEPAAQALGLSVQHSGWVSRSGGGEGLFAQPKVIAAAFSDEVLAEGHNSDMIEPERDQLQAVVLRVVDHRDAATKPLAEVRDDIVAQLKKEKAKSNVAAAVEAALKQLRQGADWSKVLEKAKPTELEIVNRSDSKVPAAILDIAFTLPIPKRDKASLGSATLDTGDGAIVRVTKVQDGEVKPMEPGKPAPEAMMISQFLGRQLYTDMVADMQSRAEIERKALATEIEP